MLTAVQTAYGPPETVVIRDTPKPVPKDNEVLVKIAAATVTSGDSRLRAFRVPTAFWLPARLFMGVTRPRNAVLGSEFAGTVEAVGASVTRIQPGDRVFGMHVFGVHAEYKVVPDTAALLTLPEGLSFEDAAAIPFGALTAHHFLELVEIGPGTRVLINGASGAVGAYAVQLAHQRGAEVTAVCSKDNAALVLSLGAQKAIDYREADFSTSGERYDVIMDTVNTVSVAQFERASTPGGVLIAVDAGGGMFARAAWNKMTGGRRIVTGMAGETLAALKAIRDLIVAGQLRAVIDSRFPLSEIAAAHARVDSGRKRGAVVVTMD